VVVRKEFAEEHPEAVSEFLDRYKASVEYVNSHIDEAAALIEKYDIVPAAVAKKALPACNITFIEGSEMKEKLSGYLSVLFEQNAKAVGGALPADDFYYDR
jgi:NitT/TauT family transport system substrate-binding protein